MFRIQEGNAKIIFEELAFNKAVHVHRDFLLGCKLKDRNVIPSESLLTTGFYIGQAVLSVGSVI